MNPESHNSEDKHSPNSEPSLEHQLNRSFARHERELRSLFAQSMLLPGTTEQTMSRYQQLVSSKLNAFISDVQASYTKSLNAAKGRLQVCQDERQALLGFRNRLLERRFQVLDHSLDDKQTRAGIIGYLLLYLLLLASVIAAYTWNFTLVFPDQERWIGLLSSTVLLGPSFFWTREYRRRTLEARDQLMRKLNLLGIWACVLLIMSYSLSRAFALSGTSLTTQNLFGTSTKAEILGALQIILPITAFAASALAEICFASVLAIHLTKLTTPRRSAESIDQQIAETETRIQNLEAEESQLDQEMYEADAFEAVVKSWAAQKEEGLILVLEAMLGQFNEFVKKPMSEDD